MARKPRRDRPGTIHHAMARGNDGQPIFRDRSDRLRFLEYLEELKRLLGFEVLDFCLMTNHFHLPVRLGDASLSQIMHRLQGRYARSFNTRWDRKGHLFQARFKSIACDNDAYFKELLRYVALNPVRAGLVADPRDWEWSGHAEYLEKSDSTIVDVDFGLSCFGRDRSGAQKAYRSFVMAGVDDPGIVIDPFEPESGEKSAAVHPMRDFTTPRSSRFKPRESLANRAMRIAGNGGFSTEQLRGPSRERRVAAVRREFILDAVWAGERLSDTARFLHRSPAAVGKVLRDAVKSSLASDDKFNKLHPGTGTPGVGLDN